MTSKQVLWLLDQLITQVPIWKLQCTVSTEAVQVAYGAMRPTENG